MWEDFMGDFIQGGINNTNADLNGNEIQRIHGTTIFIEKSDLETPYGKATSYIFQDVIDKKYVFALVFGNLTHHEFYIRMHSSCLTSETLRSMDCDCV